MRGPDPAGMQLAEIEQKPEGGEEPEPGRPVARNRWGGERTISILLIAGVVLAANATYLLHVFDPNPINQVSGLGTITQAGLLPGHNNIDPNIGFTAQALGHRAAVDWLHGQIPWWNPYEGVGAPLAGEMQSAALFPLNAFNLLPDGQVYFRVCLELLAGVATYLLLRRFTRSNLPAVVGGIAFALNGTFAWLFHAPGNPIAFLPLTLLGLEWAREGACRHQRKGWPLVALALALSLYAGFPETAFIDGLLLVLWVVVRAFGLERRALVAFAQSVAIGCGVAVLLVAPIAVAFLGYLPRADIGGHNGVFAHTSLSATTALPAQIMPYLFGPIFGFSAKAPPDLAAFWGSIGGYLSISLCTLAVIGLTGRRHRALRLALAAWIVIGLGRLVGVHWALDLVNAIPGVHSTAFYRYASPSWEFAVVVLASLGLDDLVRRSAPRLVVVAAGGALALLCLLSWHAARSVFAELAGEPHNHAWAVASLAWALATILGIVVCGLLPTAGFGGRNLEGFRQTALAAIVVIDVVAMFVTPQFSAPRQATYDVRPVDYLAQHLGTQRFFTLGPIAPDYGSYFGLGSVAVNDVPIPKSYEAFVRRHLDTNVDPLLFTGTQMADPTGPTPEEELSTHLPAYESVGVKYVVLPAGMPPPVIGGRPLPVVFSDATATIVALPHPAPLFGAVSPSCSVTHRSQTSAVVDCREPSRVVYREQSMPGWHATVNGRPATISPDGPLFQSVEVPAGTSTVEFGYAPPGALLALTAFAFGVLCLALAWVPLERVPFPGTRRRRPDRRGPGRPPPLPGAPEGATEGAGSP